MCISEGLWPGGISGSGTMTVLVDVPALWKLSKYEFVKGTIELNRDELTWTPLKASQAEILVYSIGEITGAQTESQNLILNLGP